ncbi:hypothetical protein [Bacteroides cellulosilyticus]|jgi:hypothetical protein|uniref:Uncharacterized protein n=1 Tax=Siphoviridae sp. ctrWS2 TaxID=2823602 RepID=A0A8S5LEC1_9CAUD|nr:MAG TPA: hypothetical protein [Siphoviridae sp. ctrWS2]
MKKNKGFTTPCYMVVKDGNHANRLMIALKSIGDRKNYAIQEKVSYPCICGVSTHLISICELGELTSAGFINCEDNEKLFLSLAALRNDSDINQWFTDGEKWVISDIHSLLELKEYFQLIKFDYSKTHKATAEELIKHFNS